MKISYKTSTDLSAKCDALILPTFASGETSDLSPWKAVEKSSFGKLSKKADKECFNAASGSSLTMDGSSASRIVLLGLGPIGEFTPDTMRRALGALIPSLEEAHLTNIIIALPSKASPDLIRATSEAIILGSYRFHRYRKDKERPRVSKAVILGKDPSTSAMRKALQIGVAGAKATNIARNLVNEPPLTLTPSTFARRARKLQGKGVKVSILGKNKLKKMGARALLGVSQGSSEPPCLIELRYKPEKQGTGKKLKKLAVVGKGITFDSGGLSLKPPQGMETMKCDMGGGAAVFGLFHALRQLQPDVEVVGVIAASENMPDASAQKPGDIVKAMNGKTIEVLNTDAEGRLVLADALHYMEKKHKPDAMVDLATLTGAIVVALGETRAAAYGTKNKLTKSILKAGASAGEGFWHMPLDEDLRSKLNSPVADIKNIGGDRWGGSITAALFLREFVKKTPWVHLDIAGPAFSGSPGTTIPGPAGGSGFGVRTLLEWVQNAS